MVVRGRLEAATTPALCERLLSLIEQSGAGLVICDVGAIHPCDVVTVDALARLKLVGRRVGCDVQLSCASDQLVELIAFAGLQQVLQVSIQDSVEP
jgi:anti-anti-sigma regulatory factor